MVRDYLTSVTVCGYIVSKVEESDEHIALVERHARSMGARVLTAGEFHNERLGRAERLEYLNFPNAE